VLASPVPAQLAKDPRITHSATQRSSSDRRGGDRHNYHHAGRGGAGGRGRGGGRGAGSVEDALKFRQISLMQHIQKLGSGTMWSEAIASLRKAQQQSFPVNTIIYNATITACAKSGQWEAAVQVLRELENSDVLSPTVYSYNTTITACAEAAKVQLALQILAELNDSDLQASVYSCSAAIDACANGLQCEQALQLLDEMKERSIEPHEYCYNTTITACA
jgi:pentatricopeptide repeat protein